MLIVASALTELKEVILLFTDEGIDSESEVQRGVVTCPNYSGARKRVDI